MSSIVRAMSTNGGISREISNTQVDGLEVDEFGRSKTFKILSCARPWFRAFHFSWLGFFVAFTGWFSLVPAMEYLIKDSSNDIDVNVAKTSNIVSVLGTIFVRFALGPVCEKFGAKSPMITLLLGGAVLVLLSATVNSSGGLYAIRLFIGLVGGAFVPCQYWTSMMFAKRIVGSANAFAGGWGNLGGGFAMVFMGGIISLILGSGVDETQAWRYAMICPAVLMTLVAIPMMCLSDDCPQGKWSNRLYNDPQADKSVTKSTASRASVAVWYDWRVWVMAAIYAACFGVELAINNSMSSYLYRYFNNPDMPECKELRASKDYPEECSVLGIDTSSMIASLFGLMNLFARAIGGVMSDYLFSKVGMKGRLITLFVCLFGEGIVLVIFSRIEVVGAAIPMLILFSIFVQSSEGATFAVVPFVNTVAIGQVAGIVGAGGNIGAVSWSTMFKNIEFQNDAYMYLGFIVLGLSMLVILLPIQGIFMFGCSHRGSMADDTDGGASEASEDAGDDYFVKPEPKATAAVDPEGEVNVV